MKKISEKVDLSKKVLDINIDSLVFKEMIDNLDLEIQRVIKKVYDKDFQSGEVTLKLSIEIPDAFKYFPKTNEFGELIQETYKYRKPNFKHSVTAVLKKQFKQEGVYSEEKEVTLDNDGNYVVVPIVNPQMSIDDMP